MNSLRPILAALFLGTVACLAGNHQASWTAATWNLQNYLLGIRFPEGRFRPHYPMPEARKRRIRELLQTASPDVLFLQELGSEAFLLEFQLDLRASGLDYPFAGFSAFPETRSGLAFLSRFPPVEVIFHDPVPAMDDRVLPRGIQEVRFLLQGNSFRFFHVHLKSRYSSDPLDPDSQAIRRAGFVALRRFLDRQLDAATNSSCILVGDFNTPLASPLLDGLRVRWIPLPVTDQAGDNRTYLYHKTGARDVLDAFWTVRSTPFLLRPLALLPATQQEAPSDHRLVLVGVLLSDRSVRSVR